MNFTYHFPIDLISDNIQSAISVIWRTLRLRVPRVGRERERSCVCIQINCRMDFSVGSKTRFNENVPASAKPIWNVSRHLFILEIRICCELLSPGAMNCHVSIAFLSFRLANVLSGLIRIRRGDNFRSQNKIADEMNFPNKGVEAVVLLPALTNCLW